MFIAVICMAVSLFIYNLSRNVSSQKQHIENYYGLLRMTNQVSFAVSEAQSAANLYLTSKNRAHLVSFRNKVTETEQLIDSLTYLSRLTGDTSNMGQLGQIGELLWRKGDIIYHLNTQLGSYNPVDSIASRLFIYEDTQAPPSVSDSVFLLGSRKNLLEVMSNTFLPARYRDSLLTAYSIPPDTVEIAREDSIKIAAGVRDYVEEVRTGYSSNLRELERQINSLMRTDQEISAQIIEVLNRFHRSTMQSTIRHIEDSEDTIQRNYRYSMGGIIMSLLLITLLVILIISDANKGQSSRAALERANRRIREIMASRHKLLLSVSHDIKTPLNAILGYLELWKEGQHPEDSQLEAAQMSGKHIGSLVNNLLEFSSLQQGISKPSPQPVGLLSFCEETAGIVRPLATRKGLTFITSFEVDPGLKVSADPMRIRQIILNILSNAVKYTTAGTVTFEAGYRDGNIRISICDTGSGIGPQDMERIFKPFSRLDGNRALAEGHGYGMYVVKGLVELLGGVLDIDSTPGTGTTVKIEIPATLTGPPAESRTDLNTAPKRILFVDDDTVLLQVLSSFAVKSGHRAETTSRPQNIISGVMDLAGYDMVITDMEMGTFSGTGILKAVRSRYPGMPVYIMTGRTEITAAVAREMGFDGYLGKPVTIGSLRSVTGDAAPNAPEPVSLHEMFDRETLREITEMFVTACTQDFKTLRSAVFRRDHRKVREICHRLLPLFTQFGAEECVEVLGRLNGQSPETRGKTQYWKDVERLIETGSDFIDELAIEDVAEP